MQAVKPNIILTADGSHSLSLSERGPAYHSVHGAIQESMHVFIEAGLRYAWKNHGAEKRLHIAEMGFGTGLNALLTLADAEKERREIAYEAIEPLPIDRATAAALNYCARLNRPDLEQVFLQMHALSPGEETAISPWFHFKRTDKPLAGFSTAVPVDLLYFDAFAPAVQPELWTAAVFARLHGMMAAQGVLVTYCSKSIVRRAMQEAGFRVEKIPGPPHKREILRALKG